MGKYVEMETILQNDEQEGGAACLAMIFSYFGKKVSLEQMKSEINVTENGYTALDMINAAKRYGLDCKGYRKEAEALKELTPPCIIHWNYNHFVVFEGFKGKYAYINDPVVGERKLTWEELDNNFTKVVLTFSKTDTFQADKENNIFSKLFKI